MVSLQKMGGFASLIAAATFVVGMVLLLTLVTPAGYGSLEVDPVENVAFLVTNQGLMYAWHLIIYVTFGVCLVVLVLALHERLVGGTPSLVRVATAFGMIWGVLMFASGMTANIGARVVADVYARDPAQAGTVWLALQFVVDGLGGGNEIVGGLWVLLLSWAALRSGKLPKALNILGVVSGAAGLVTVVPLLSEVGAIFGLGCIVWFAWLGIVMMRGVTQTT